MLPEPPTARVLLVDDKPQNLLALEAALSNLRIMLIMDSSLTAGGCVASCGEVAEAVLAIRIVLALA